MDKGKKPCTKLSCESLIHSESLPTHDQNILPTKLTLDPHPQPFLSSLLGAKNTSGACLGQSVDAAKGRYTLEEITLNQCISSLQQINEATTAQHRDGKSKGTSNPKIGPSVVVQRYSGLNQAGSHQLEQNVKKAREISSLNSDYMKMMLHATEKKSTSRKIMKDMGLEDLDDMEQVSVIYGKSKYNLCNKFEAQTPPYGHGEPILPTIDMGSASVSCQINFNSNETYSESLSLPAKNEPQPKSKAHGKLKDIMLSSNSVVKNTWTLQEKPKPIIHENSCGRQRKKVAGGEDETNNTRQSSPIEQITSPIHRSKSLLFASALIENANRSRQGSSGQALRFTFLTSQPAQPHTSKAAGHKIEASYINQHHNIVAYSDLPLRSKPNQTRVNPSTLNLPADEELWKLDLGILTCLFPWTRYRDLAITSSSHAEATLRELLRSTEINKKVRHLKYFD